MTPAEMEEAVEIARGWIARGWSAHGVDYEGEKMRGWRSMMLARALLALKEENAKLREIVRDFLASGSEHSTKHYDVRQINHELILRATAAMGEDPDGL